MSARYTYMSARAIQVSVVHLTAGVAFGSLIEAAMPAYSASSSIAVQAYEALVQIALNGVLIAQVGATLQADDPTFGVPFQVGLMQAQEGLSQRISFLGGAARGQIQRYARKMAPPAPMEDRPTRDL
jgi:hypothetical protein